MYSYTEIPKKSSGQVSCAGLDHAKTTRPSERSSTSLLVFKNNDEIEGVDDILVADGSVKFFGSESNWLLVSPSNRLVENINNDSVGPEAGGGDAEPISKSDKIAPIEGSLEDLGTTTSLRSMASELDLGSRVKLALIKPDVCGPGNFLRQRWTDIKLYNPLFLDSANDVPVLLSIKFLHGPMKGNIHYHYLFPPPPVWNLPRRHEKFMVVDSPPLLLGKKQSRNALLDKGIGEVLLLARESVMGFYGGQAAEIGLGPKNWLKFVTDYNGSEIVTDTTFKKLIHRFLVSKPIVGSPLIVTPLEGYERLQYFSIVPKSALPKPQMTKDDGENTDDLMI